MLDAWNELFMDEAVSLLKGGCANEGAEIATAVVNVCGFATEAESEKTGAWLEERENVRCGVPMKRDRAGCWREVAIRLELDASLRLCAEYKRLLSEEDAVANDADDARPSEDTSARAMSRLIR